MSHIIPPKNRPHVNTTQLLRKESKGIKRKLNGSQGVFFTEHMQIIQLKQMHFCRKSASAVHLSKPTPKWLIIFVLTSAHQGAKHCSTDYFHLEESGKKKPTHNTQHFIAWWHDPAKIHSISQTMSSDGGCQHFLMRKYRGLLQS